MDSSATGLRVLLIEDEPAISQVCRRVLANEGFTVDSAVNGKVAQNMLKRRSYDLILADIKTPVMDGKEFYQHLHEQHALLVSRVIFTTGDVIGGETKQFLEQSGRPVLAKPFTPDELRKIIRETLGQVGR